MPAMPTMPATPDSPSAAPRPPGTPDDGLSVAGEEDPGAALETLVHPEVTAAPCAPSGATRRPPCRPA